MAHRVLSVRSLPPLATGLLVLTSACAGAPSAADPPTVTVEAPPASAPLVTSAPTSSAAEPAPPAPAAAPATAQAITLPAVAACTFDTARFRAPRTGTELHLHAGGPVFAKIDGARGHLAVPMGPATGGATLEASDAGLTLRGQVESPGITLHAASAIVLGEVAIPHAFTALTWTDATAGKMTVKLDAVDGVSMRAPLTGAAPCAALSLDFGDFKPEAGVTGPKGAARRAVLDVGRAVALSASPGGPPLVDLNADDENDGEVKAVSVSGKHTRILWDRHAALMFGWVASADLHAPKGPEVGAGYGSGGGSGFGRSVHPVARATCPDEMPVFAEAGGERWLVGSVKAGTTIEEMDRGSPDVEIWVKTGAMQVVAGARLLMPAVLLSRCPARAP